MMDINKMRRLSHGDNRRSAWHRSPEIIAQEQRVLLMADALVSWLQEVDFGPDSGKVNDFFTHEFARNPAGQELCFGKTRGWLLDRMDPDANRILMTLIQAAWHRRQWQEKCGERVPGESM